MTDSDRHHDECDRRPDRGARPADDRLQAVRGERTPERTAERAAERTAERTARPASARVDRRTFIAGGLRVGGAVTAASLGVEALGRPRFRAGAPPREPGPYRRASQPNILVIMVDQLRMPRWFGPGAAAPPLPPNIAALARVRCQLRSPLHRLQRLHAGARDAAHRPAHPPDRLHDHRRAARSTRASRPGARCCASRGTRTYWYGKWHLTRGDRQWTTHDGPPALERYGFAGGTYPSPNGAPGQGWRVDPQIAEPVRATGTTGRRRCGRGARPCRSSTLTTSPGGGAGAAFTRPRPRRRAGSARCRRTSRRPSSSPRAASRRCSTRCSRPARSPSATSPSAAPA